MFVMPKNCHDASGSGECIVIHCDWFDVLHLLVTFQAANYINGYRVLQVRTRPMADGHRYQAMLAAAPISSCCFYSYVGPSESPLLVPDTHCCAGAPQYSRKAVGA